MSTSKPQILITFDEQLKNDVDNFRYTYRYPNRNMAVRQLIRIGLDAVSKDPSLGEKNAQGKIYF